MMGEAQGGRIARELGILFRAVQRGVKGQAVDGAAAIAYFSFLSVFPLLLGVIAAVGYFLDSPEAQARLAEIVSNTLPGSADFVRQNLEAVIGARGALGTAGVLGLLLSGSAAFGAITRAVNRSLGVPPSRPYLLAKVRYFLMALGLAVLVLLSLAVSAVFGVMTSLDPSVLEGLGIPPELLSGLTSTLTSLVLGCLIFGLIYKTTPYVETRWRQIAPGTILAAVAFELGKNGFLIYLGRLANFEAVYGPLSSIVVLLVWFFLSALILIFGAEYNLVRWQSLAGSPDPLDAEEPAG
jgi:membrane protein